MPIKVKCPNPACARIFKVPDHHGGKTTICPVCKSKMPVPTLDEIEGPAASVPLIPPKKVSPEKRKAAAAGPMLFVTPYLVCGIILIVHAIFLYNGDALFKGMPPVKPPYSGLVAIFSLIYIALGVGLILREYSYCKTGALVAVCIDTFMSFWFFMLYPGSVFPLHFFVKAFFCLAVAILLIGHTGAGKTIFGIVVYILAITMPLYYYDTYRALFNAEPLEIEKKAVQLESRGGGGAEVESPGGVSSEEEGKKAQEQNK